MSSSKAFAAQDVSYHRGTVGDAASFTTNSLYSEKFEVDGAEHPAPHWSPILLHAIPTGIFAGFLLLLISASELFNRHSPYNAPSTNLQFVWTYLPVGALMIVNWICAAYDLQIKILVPWAAMSRGPTPADQSWLLDYIGVNPIVGLWTAFRYRHIVVLLTTVGLWMTALAGIITTSLFQLQENVQMTAADFDLTTSLNRSLLTDFDPSILVAKQYVSSYLGRQVAGLSRPYWTTSDDIVLEAFENPLGSSAADRLIAQTQGYSASLDCLPAPISYGGNVSIPANPPIPALPVGFALFVNVNATGCTIQYPLTDTNHLLVCGNGDDDTPECLVGRMYNHTCPGSSTYTTALVMAYTRNYTFVSASAVECTPSYSQYLLEVSASPVFSGQVNSSKLSHSADSLMNGSLNGMLQWINATNSGPPRANTVTGSNEMDPFIFWGQVENRIPCDCDPWLFLITHAQQLDILDLMDPATLLNASTASFPGLFSELAQALLMTPPPPSSAPLAGMVQSPTWQLVARPVSIRIVQVAMSVLFAVVVAVYFLCPVTSLPMNPSSMAAQAVLLASNHDNISAIIKDTITETSADTHALLKHHQFWIETRGEFRITAERQGIDSLSKPQFFKAPVWRPVILHPVFKLFLGLIVTGTIIGLELGLRRSQRNVGFADVLPSTQEWWPYAAPSYLFVLGLLLSSYAFSVSTLEPFFAMHRLPQPPRKSVTYSPASKTAVGLLLHSLPARSPTGFLCAVTLLMIPFLKIVVSGLITVASQPAERIAFLAATTAFNTTSPLGSDTLIDLPKQVFALSQIEKYQLPLPVWTTSEGAIAQVDTTRLIPITRSANTTVTIPLDVMRADLGNCSTVDVPTEILQSQWGLTLAELTLPTSPGWFGRAYGLIWTSSNSTVEASDGYTFIYGRTQPTNASEIQEATVVQCLSYTVSVAMQNVTLAYTNNSVEILSLGSAAMRSSTPMQNISYQPDPDPVTTLQESGIPSIPTYETNSSLLFDTLFQVMTLRDPSMPLEAFLEPETLIKAVQVLFTTYGAITVSMSYRIPIPEASQKFIAATVNYHNNRIVQAEAPTRILQVLLGSVLAFCLVTGLLVRHTNNILTKSPYTIGATMGLLVDSAFVELKDLKMIRDEAELDRMLEPYKFQLGWGNNPNGGRRFGVDIVQ